MIESHRQGIPYHTVIKFMTAAQLPHLSLERVRFIANNIKGYTILNRPSSDSQQSTWIAGRDFTPQLRTFEEALFRKSLKIFGVFGFLSMTLDDELFGTRANDNQVKTLSNRKADKEGHTADVVCDALFRTALGIRFRRRGISQAENVSSLMRHVINDESSLSIRGTSVTADRGYSNISCVSELCSMGFGVVMIFPSHLKECHPFASASSNNGKRNNDFDGSGDSDSEDGDNVDIERRSSLLPARRPRKYVVDDKPHFGPLVVMATKLFKVAGESSRRSAIEVAAVAIRERGDKDHAAVHRFAVSIPGVSIGDLARKWTAVPYKTLEDPDNTLFACSPRTSEDANESLLSFAETMLSEECFPLTVQQRSADWFVLRKFRVTGTTAATLMRLDAGLRRNFLKLDSELSEEQIELRDNKTKLFSKLMKSWFSFSRSTDVMKRGQVNEGPVLSYLRCFPWVAAIFVCGLVAKTRYPFFACSPDGIAVFKASPDQPDFTLATVEIKTAVASSTIENRIANSSIDAYRCEFGEHDFIRLVPSEHRAQILHQLFVTNLRYCLYVCAFETGVAYSVLVHASDPCIQAVEVALSHFNDLINWAHPENDNDERVLPEFIDNVQKDIVESWLRFYDAVNRKVKASGPFVPGVRLFKHSIQSIYSKTKGGVDGMTQWRSIMRSPTSSMKWEQKLVTQCLKTVLVNAFIGFRLLQVEHLLGSSSSFKSLTAFRNSLNAVESFPTFLYETSTELTAWATFLREQAEGNANEVEASTENGEVEPGDSARLKDLALKRKRNRLDFFNSVDGISLRFTKLL